MGKIRIQDGVDAVFLPGKIHSCEWQAYIIYLNEQANDGKGSWEIEIVDKERILQIYEEVNGDHNQFFEALPNCFQGEWYYCNSDTKEFDKYVEAYPTADFVLGYHGDAYEEMMFLANWARDKVCPECGFPIMCQCVIGADESLSGLIERLYSCRKCGSAWSTQENDGEESAPQRYFFG